MDLSQRFKQDPDIVSREIAGEYILVPVRNNVGDLDSIYTLNETAAFTWALLDGDNSLQEILNRITTEFIVEKHQAEQDLVELIRGLEEIKAVRKV